MISGSATNPNLVVTTNQPIQLTICLLLRSAEAHCDIHTLFPSDSSRATRMVFLRTNVNFIGVLIQFLGQHVFLRNQEATGQGRSVPILNRSPTRPIPICVLTVATILNFLLAFSLLHCCNQFLTLGQFLIQPRLSGL